MTARTGEQNNILLAFRLLSHTLEHIVSLRHEKREFFFTWSDSSQTAPMPYQQPLAVDPELEEILRVRSRSAQIEVYGSIHSHLYAFRQLCSRSMTVAVDQHDLANQSHPCPDRKLRRFRIGNQPGEISLPFAEVRQQVRVRAPRFGDVAELCQILQRLCSSSRHLE